MANLAQLCTQHAYMRALGVVLIFGSFAKKDGAEIYRCDPTGIFDGFTACAAGIKEQEAMSTLEQSLKDEPKMTFEKTIEIAVNTIQKVAGADLKADELEIAVVNKNG
ncbi:Proteasome subunit alpha type-6 [Bonamia ostreae]